MNREGKKCVLYPRVSTEMQVDGYSLEGQKNGLKRFADREEMEIVGIYEDAGKSGKSIEGRPAFKKMLSDIKNGLEIDYILVYKGKSAVAAAAYRSGEKITNEWDGMTHDYTRKRGRTKPTLFLSCNHRASSLPAPGMNTAGNGTTA